MELPPIYDRLRQLGLTAMAAVWSQQQTLPDCTTLPFGERFGLLIEAEWAVRDQRGIPRRVHVAQLRVTATSESVEGQSPRDLPRPNLQQLWRSQEVDHQTVLVPAPPWHRSPGPPPVRRRGDREYDRPVAAVAPTVAEGDLLLLDDWGLSPFTVEASHDLFEVLDDRHQVRATVAAGQVPVAQWAPLFPDATVGEAILDRLVHQAIRRPLTGECMRKVLAVAGRSGTTDLTPTG